MHLHTERDIAEYQERKVHQLQDKAAEKRRVSTEIEGAIVECGQTCRLNQPFIFTHMHDHQDLEMLQSYKPWGKQTGGGAPRVNID